VSGARRYLVAAPGTVDQSRSLMGCRQPDEMESTSVLSALIASCEECTISGCGCNSIPANRMAGSRSPRRSSDVVARAFV
jgi:hypothetical protein